MKRLILLALCVITLGQLPVQGQEQKWANVPFEMMAPYLMQAGMYDQVNQFLAGRTSFDKDYEAWSALWIACPDAPAKDYGVYYFRKDVEINNLPESFKVHVTADQRYKLYVNGTLVSVGPARGADIKHWNYATLDLRPYLKEGKNVVAAQVWNMGKHSPQSENTIHTGFLLMGEGEAHVLTTNNTWKVLQAEGYAPKAVDVPGFYAVDASDLVDMHKAIDWQNPNDDLSAWKDAKPFELPYPVNTSSGTGGYDGTHLLQASILPQMEMKEVRLQKVRLNGGLNIPSTFLAQPTNVTIPAGKTVDILLDNGVLTNAYFHLLFSKGNNANIQLTFSETLYDDKEGNTKSNRNEVEGKFQKGRVDEVISSGAVNQEFTTLSWRTYRYVNLHITTQEEALTLNDLYGTFIGYPLELKASLDTDNQELKQMLEIGWRTQRLCTIETYFDCPTYEQLMYLGDTRIQALTTLYNNGDDRMVRNYLIQSDLSKDAEGMTTGHTPLNSSRQYITPYALSYIYAIHDYLMYGTDEQFTQDLMVGAEQIMRYFKRHQQADGRIYKLPGWNFSDWVYTEGWNMGVAERGADGTSSLMDFQLLYGYQMMADLEKHFGNDYLYREYSQRAEQLKKAIQACYYDAARGLYADRSEKDHFSQHANAWAILTGMVEGEQAKNLGRKLTTDTSLAPCSVYYKYYLHEALIKAGLGDEFLSWLDIWRENIAMGLTTWAETSDLVTTRSDCHAWGASPNIEFFRTLLGIDSASAGFKTVKIEPHLGDIQKIGGTMPHPQGQITVAYQQTKKGLKATVELPAGITGTLVWKGKSQTLHGGKNVLTL